MSTGTQLNVHDIQAAIKALYATGQFDDVQIICRVAPTTGKAGLVIQVKERPILTDYKVIGADRVSPKDVKEKLALRRLAAPSIPAKIAKAIASADSLYESKGYYLASIKADSTITDGKLSINFSIDEGRRLAISGIRINGNNACLRRRHRRRNGHEAGGLPVDAQRRVRRCQVRERSERAHSRSCTAVAASSISGSSRTR